MQGGIFEYWGKADANDAGEATWHPLVHHCLDVAACGQVLLARQPAWLEKLERLSGIEQSRLVPWIVFLLAIHDIGKFGEGFQTLPKNPFGRIPKVAYDVRHDTLGYVLAMECLAGWLGRDPHDEIDLLLLSPWLAAVTGHHGRPPRNVPARALVARQFPADVIDDARSFVGNAQRLLFQSDWCLPEPAPGVAEQQQRASWLIAGLSVLADWLGSNTRWFEYQPPELSIPDYWNKIALPQAERAVSESGLLSAKPALDTGFAKLFPSIAATQTPLQNWADAVPIAAGPQLFVLEELTGSGKTEAALTLAGRLMAAGCGQGIYFALPTMATADAMFDRVRKKSDGGGEEVWQRFFATGEPSLVLAYSAAKTKLEAMQHRDAGYGSRREEVSASQYCSAWLADGRKKALLADFGVGTVDQALLGILQLRHQSLRLLGLSSKVLVVDEVHACDCYMGELLGRLLYFHAAQGGSAILLSATLPLEQRARLLAAFAQGAGYFAPKPDPVNAYPLASHFHADRLDEVAISARKAVSRKVVVKALADEEAVLQRLHGTVAMGGCAVWVRNTVADAIDAYQSWNARFPEHPAILFHARFALCDRLCIGGGIGKDFGSSSTADTRRGKLVIATQVVEQSLDVDFDDMVSDLAPIDLIIQRAGRLQRHKRDEAGNTSDTEERGGACLGVLTPEPVKDAGADWFKCLLPKAARVYADHGRLWLTANWLVTRGYFELPRDARPMIEAVYGEESYSDVPDRLKRSSDAQLGACCSERSIARQNALYFDLGYDPTGNTWPDEDAHAEISTRLGDKTVRLRLARRLGDRLTSWATSGRNIDWPLSELTVHRRLVAGESPRYSGLLEQARKGMVDEGRYCVIVPLEPCGDDWRGWAVNQEDQEIRVIYSEESGLRIEKGEALDESDI